MPAGLRGQGVGHRRDQKRAEREREQWKPERHDYTSILMTCLIQKNPIACMMIDADDHHLAHPLFEQAVHVLGVDERQRDCEKRRQRHQHVTGEPAVRGVHAHLAANLESLADDGREVVENLRQVAAGLALNEHGGREEAHVEQRHAQAQIVQRFLERQAEVLLVERLAELRTRPARRARRPPSSCRR